jgi:type I restriction enzyme S subunit
MSWPAVPLQEVADIERSSVKPEEIASGTSYLGLEHIESGGAIIGREQVENGDLASNKFIFGPHHILYGKLRPYLAKIALPDFEGICSTDILPVLPSQRVDRSYLAHFLRQPAMVEFASSRSTGANLPRLSPKSLAEFPIPLPPLEEQRRIAGILDQADALRRLRTRALDKLNTLGQAIFHEMFGDPVSNNRDWPTAELGVAGIMVSDGNYAEKYPKASDFVDSGVPFVRANNIANGTVSSADLRFISEEKHALLKKGHLEANDVLITTRGKIGNVAIVPPQFHDANINAQLVLLRCTGRALRPRFLMHLLAQPSTQRVFEKIQTGVALKQLPVKRLKALEIIVPSAEQQQLFEDRIVQITASVSSSLRATSNLQNLFASLQHRAFRGEL